MGDELGVALFLFAFHALHRAQVSQREQLLSGIRKQNFENVMTAMKNLQTHMVWCTRCSSRGRRLMTNVMTGAIFAWASMQILSSAENIR